MSGYDQAKKYLGLNEVKDRKTLMALFKAQGSDLAVDPSATPWCAVFVNAMERLDGHKGTGKLNARSFLSYGTNVDKSPQPGDIVIFSRGAPNSGHGHVGYVVEILNKNGLKWVKVLGGNQTGNDPTKSDTISIKIYPYSRILGFRRV